MFSLVEDYMKKVKEQAGQGVAEAARSDRAKTGKELEEPCDKAFNQETARLEDADEACDDGVR